MAPRCLTSNGRLIRKRKTRTMSYFAASVRCFFFPSGHHWQVQRLSVVLAIGIISTGCQSKKLFPVHGNVVHKDGSPMTAGMVIFEPVGQKISSRGEIKPDGSFQLGTYTDND